jgi:hypothetical protein
MQKQVRLHGNPQPTDRVRAALWRGVTPVRTKSCARNKRHVLL